MELYFLRHGIAVDHGTLGYKKDSDRPLTEEGESKMADIADAMKKLGISFDVILSSPYVRARQTAEIVADRLGLKKKLKFSDHLACGGDRKKLFEEINHEYPTAKSLVLVGHEPCLSEMIAVLVSGSAEAPVMMEKGSFCKLLTASPAYKKCASLEWLLTPKQMIAMVND